MHRNYWLYQIELNRNRGSYNLDMHFQYVKKKKEWTCVE